MRFILWVSVVVLLNACATGVIKEQPAALPESLPNTADMNVQWWHILSEKHSAQSFGQLYPTVFGETAYVPLTEGLVFELDADGEIVKQTQVAGSIVAPLSIDNQQIVVITGEGEVKLMDLDYNEIWSIGLTALSSEPALVTPERIFIQTIDGRVNAIERITGRLLWVYQDAQPNLTLAGTSAPVLISTAKGSAVVSGLANGKLIALDVVDGSTVWEYRIARASGKTDVSRLVDVDSQVTVLDKRLIATGYQGDLVVIETASGRVLQAKSFSSYRSILAGEDLWYGVNAQSHLVALDPKDLSEVWTITDFEYRQLSEVLLKDYVLYVGDAQGYMHAIDAHTGEWLTSRHIDYRGSNSNPVSFGDGILFQGYSSRVKSLNLMNN